MPSTKGKNLTILARLRENKVLAVGPCRNLLSFEKPGNELKKNKQTDRQTFRSDLHSQNE